MSAGLVILGFSLALFLYWFRYTCLLILSAKGVKDYTARVAETNGLELVRVQTALGKAKSAEELDALRQALSRDYQLLTGILRHTSRFQITGFSVEQRMLMMDFLVMQGWFLVLRPMPNAEGHLRRAVAEMADIVAHFANTMGERRFARNAAR